MSSPQSTAPWHLVAWIIGVASLGGCSFLFMEEDTREVPLADLPGEAPLPLNRSPLGLPTWKEHDPGDPLTEVWTGSDGAAWVASMRSW